MVNMSEDPLSNNTDWGRKELLEEQSVLMQLYPQKTPHELTGNRRRKKGVNVVFYSMLSDSERAFHFGRFPRFARLSIW
jgi:hypothetical protein